MEALDKNKIGHFLKDLVVDARKFIDSDEVMILVSALTMMSVVLGNRVHTYDGTRSELYPNIWSLIIARSGMGSKSSTLAIVEKMILQSTMDYYAFVYQNEMNEYKKLTKDEQEKTDPPRKRQIISGQGSTFQGIIKSLQNSKYGMIAIYDEARELFKKLNKDVENKAGFTSLYDKKFYGKDLVGAHGNGISVNIEQPFLSILATTNPDWFHYEIKAADYTSGFFNRFIIIDITDYEKLQAFKSTKQQNFEKFQNCSLEIAKYLDKHYSISKPLAIDTSLIEDRYRNWFDEQIQKYEASENHFKSFLLRQLAGALKYAIIIQIYDYFYLGKDIEELKKIDSEYMEIGMYLAELFLRYIESHLDNVSLDNGEFNIQKQYSTEGIAQKVITFLSKRKDQKFRRSDLCNNIRNLNAKNFDEVMYVAGKQEITLEETDPEEIEEFNVPKEYWIPSVSSKITNIDL